MYKSLVQDCLTFLVEVEGLRRHLRRVCAGGQKSVHGTSETRVGHRRKRSLTSGTKFTVLHNQG